MTHGFENGQENRRSFLSFAIYGMGAIFSAILGVPVLCYFIDPRHRKVPESTKKLVDGVKLDELQLDVPMQGVVRDRRMDGWTLYPNDVIGRVWVVRMGERPAELTSRAAAIAFNRDDDVRKRNYLMVFTTICPHLGCSVNVGGPGFACPCHAATFNLNGTRADEGNPAQRGMDILEWEIDVDDPDLNRIKVKFQKYQANEAMKIPIGGGPEETPNP